MLFKDIKEMKNKYLKVLTYIFLGFILIDSLQIIIIYPLIFLNVSKGLEKIIRFQLPEYFQNLSTYVICIILIGNVIIRFIATKQIIKENVLGLIIGIISCLYTIAVVVFLLSANIWWETVVMIGLIILLIMGYKDKFIRKKNDIFRKKEKL